MHFQTVVPLILIVSGVILSEFYSNIFVTSVFLAVCMCVFAGGHEWVVTSGAQWGSV